jgi:hypothetical protein
VKHSRSTLALTVAALAVGGVILARRAKRTEEVLKMAHPLDRPLLRGARGVGWITHDELGELSLASGVIGDGRIGGTLWTLIGQHHLTPCTSPTFVAAKTQWLSQLRDALFADHPQTPPLNPAQTPVTVEP